MATPVAQIPVRSGYEFGDPAPNAVGRQALVSTEGCVVHLDAGSAPRLLWYGEDLLDIKMPAGTRVVYPKPAIKPLPDRDEGIRYALAPPRRDGTARSVAQSRHESNDRDRRRVSAASQDAESGSARIGAYDRA